MVCDFLNCLLEGIVFNYAILTYILFLAETTKTTVIEKTEKRPIHYTHTAPPTRLDCVHLEHLKQHTLTNGKRCSFEYGLV